MDKENIPVITDKEELYDKCENMEQLFDEYYLPLLDKHYSKVYELQQENKQLKERIAYLERSNNRREDTILEQRQEISDLEDNWNKLKEYIKKNIIYDDVGMKILDPRSLEDYIQELEQGSDSNVKD